MKETRQEGPLQHLKLIQVGEAVITKKNSKLQIKIKYISEYTFRM